MAMMIACIYGQTTIDQKTVKGKLNAIRKCQTKFMCKELIKKKYKKIPVSCKGLK